MDHLARGHSPSSHIRFTYVEASGLAGDLEQRHLSGPTAGLFLAQGLVAVALFSADLSADDETISLQIQLGGAVGGLLVDATKAGDLRGYTHEKVMNEFDDSPAEHLADALGEHGDALILQSNPNRILHTGRLQASPPDVRAFVARYYNQSRQVPAAAALFADSQAGHLRYARGIVAEKMPDGDSETFIRILEAFDSGEVKTRLETSAGLWDFADLFGLTDLAVVETWDLRFQCRCTQEKILRTIQTLSVDDLFAIIEQEERQLVTCHFCGQDFTVGVEAVQKILTAKMGTDSAASNTTLPPNTL